MGQESTRLKELSSAIENLEVVEEYIKRIEGGGGWDAYINVNWQAGNALPGYSTLSQTIATLLHNDWQHMLNKARQYLEREITMARHRLSLLNDHE